MLPEKANFSMIIGKGGANIKEVRKRHNISMDIDRHAARDGSRLCHLKGESEEDLQAAALLIAHLGAGMPMPAEKAQA